MTKVMTALWLLFGVIAGIGTYMMSHEVERLERQYSEIEREIRDDQETVHVLRAEWSYLNDPERLESLADRFLTLQPVSAEQIAEFNEVPDEKPTMFYRIDKFGETVRYLPVPRSRPELIEAGDALITGGAQ